MSKQPHSVPTPLDVETGEVQPAPAQASTSQRTWGDWFESFFVLPDSKDEGETHNHVSDSKAAHFGYQISAAEEVRCILTWHLLHMCTRSWQCHLGAEFNTLHACVRTQLSLVPWTCCQHASGGPSWCMPPSGQHHHG